MRAAEPPQDLVVSRAAGVAAPRGMVARARQRGPVGSRRRAALASPGTLSLYSGTWRRSCRGTRGRRSGMARTLRRGPPRPHICAGILLASAQVQGLTAGRACRGQRPHCRSGRRSGERSRRCGERSRRCGKGSRADDHERIHWRRHPPPPSLPTHTHFPPPLRRSSCRLPPASLLARQGGVVRRVPHLVLPLLGSVPRLMRATQHSRGEPWTEPASLHGLRCKLSGA
jgi:hypothetical protein